MANFPTIVKIGNHWNDGLPWDGAVLRVQFYADRKGLAADDPLHRLMRAILADAVRCFQTGFNARQATKQRLFAEAWSWIFSDENDGVFSFRALCDVLEIDPNTIRKALVSWWKERLRDNTLGRKRSMVATAEGIRAKGRKIALRRSRFT
jgi:hypothetical protein